MRVVFITKKTSAKVTGDVGPQVMAFPHLLVREAIALHGPRDRPGERGAVLGCPARTIGQPAADAQSRQGARGISWGLQELLHYFPPLVAGIIIPTLVVIALIVIPYFNVNIQGKPLWSEEGSERFWIFLAVTLVLTSVLVWTRAWTVLVPTDVIAGLMLYSYFASSRRGAPTGYLPTRPLSWWVMTWFISWPWC